MHLHRRIAVAAIAALLVLSGCTGAKAEAEPTPSDAPSTGSVTAEPTATPTPTPSATAVPPPQPPADLARTDEVGAAAAATYFISLYSYVMQTGNLNEWVAMSAEECSFCSGIRDDATSIAADGGKYQGGHVYLENVKVLARDELIGGYPIDAHFTQDPSTHTSNDGSIVSQSQGDSGVVRIDVLHTGDSWKVLAVAVRDA